MTIIVKVVEGKCMGDYHKVGDEWKIGSFTPEGICLGAWGSVYPYVMALERARMSKL